MKQLLFLFLLCQVSAIAIAQNDVCRKSTEGTDFWFGFMESRNYNQVHFLEITVTAKETTSFQIFAGSGEEPLTDVQTVQANNSKQVRIPWERVEATGSEEIQDRGIRLKSEKPVNVYALNWDRNSADVAVIYPVGSLGMEYFAMCYQPDIDKANPLTGNGRNSEFLIVATEDQTRVDIIPSRTTHKGILKGTLISVTLNKGQVYQVQSENVVGSHLEGQGDLTGSHIAADKPVAFFSGSLSTRIPVGKCCWDHLYEQIPPVHSWGMEFFLVPLKTRQVDRYRIMAANDNTIVYITGQKQVVLNRGEYYEMELYHNNPARILANKPVLVAQFSQSRDVDKEFTGGDGDPFMIILSPVNQTQSDVTFVAYTSPGSGSTNYEGITRYFVNVITPTEEVEHIRLNGAPVADKFQKFSEGNYSFAQLTIDAGTHRLVSPHGGRGFLAYAYGFGGVESYGYGVGFNLDLTLDLGESLYFEGDTLLLCHGDTTLLDAGPYFDSYLWSDGEVSQSRKVSTGGWYRVKTTTNDGCVLEDSVFVFISHPSADLGTVYEEGCFPWSVELGIDDDYKKYVWQNDAGDTLSLLQHYTASETGKYRITVYDGYNCMSADTMELRVYQVPEITLEGPSLVCGTKTAGIKATITGTPDSIWNFENSIRWSTGSNSLQLSDASAGSVTLTAAQWGNYEVYYHLKTVDDCEKTDTFRIRFHPQPDSDFKFDTDDRCEGYSQLLTFSGTASDSADFFWNLNGIRFIDTLGYQTYTVSIGAYLSNPPSVSLFINDNGCMSDTAVKYSGAAPNFTMEASPARGCDQLTVDFSSRLLVDDDVDFRWEFHDGTTHTHSSVTRAYNEPGFYKAGLTITNRVTQCINSFTIDSMVRVYPTPAAEIKADPQYCYPDTVQLIYTNSIDSSMCYWDFEGMHQVDNGTDTILVAIDDPFGRVQLVVDEYGCLSQPDHKELRRKPRVDFYSPVMEGCQPFTTEVFAETTDSNIGFEWVQDTLPHPVGNPFTFNSSLPGEFDIELITHSLETGCSDTLTKINWLKVYPKPGADILVDYPVAILENAHITFTNRTPLGEIYVWDFDDGNYSEEFNAVHTYTEIGEYFVKLIAESAYGCVDTAEVTISVLPSTVYAPNAFSPTSSIEENRTFMPVKMGIDLNRFKLSIYNRQGRVVYTTDSPSSPWDGTMPDGRPAHMGNYIWLARYYDVQGIEREIKGQVLLIR